MNIFEKIQKIEVVARRNSIILSIKNFKAKKNRVNLNWAPVCEGTKGGVLFKKKDTDVQNLGDYLAVPIFDYMTKKNNIDKDKKVSGTKHLYTIGSLILLGHQDATIWGSGILFAEPDGFIWKRNKYRKLDIRCVRGPKTKKRLEENGYDVSKCKMGDPGVLMPLIYSPKKSENKKDYSVILHMCCKNDSIENQIDILTDDWKKTIDEICNSKLVISSSLHGIILAEAYGIPAVLYGKIEGNDMFKYEDYYLSTGRNEIPVCHSIEEALKMPVPKVPDLTKLQQNLLESFPVDLWN